MDTNSSAAYCLAQRARWHVGVLDDEVRDENIALTPAEIVAVKQEIARIRLDLNLVDERLDDRSTQGRRVWGMA